MPEANTIKHINRFATATSDSVAMGVSNKWSLRSGSFLDSKRGIAQAQSISALHKFSHDGTS